MLFGQVVEVTFGLVRASYSLPDEWHPLELTLFCTLLTKIFPLSDKILFVFGLDNQIVTRQIKIQMTIIMKL